MFPNNSPQNQLEPSNSPGISPAGGQPTVEAVRPPLPPSPSAPDQASSNLAAVSASRARQAMQQYARDPHKLSDALQEIKADYLAQQYHITPGQN